ncbi:hypothetical protein Poly51_16320 [Rubripirellula tenax]|uniref:GNT-I family protein n=1 Tax=Rubripirellula tenax TaxID=2528015 RepID=A0A5C6FDN5_9BACT|nr:glycosyltransferase family 2 protein [Rubripirellula tenax]TWU58852.1 hypothetical protein Poly51_16320 [Rubripirellula tenax]
MLDVPVAFVIFNRPEPTRISFEKIRAAKPTTLFLISDAARPDREGEAQRVAQSRAIAETVDWPCEVHRIYADTNMGCGRRISTGISAAMEVVDRLIVLEDDCLAEETFFPYCAELLERYEDDTRVMAVSGNNFQLGHNRGDASYYFSKYPHCWGWATWRRAWQHFDLNIPNWPAFRDDGGLTNMCQSRQEIEYWTEIFDKVHAGRSQSWAFPWTLTTWMQNGLTVLPQVNLVTNIGFGEDATHTRRASPHANLPTRPIGTIEHPKWITRDIAADQFTDRFVFSGTVRRGPIKRIEKAIKKFRRAA